MDAVKLYNKYTIEELQKKMNEIQNNPKNKQEGFYLYTKQARKNLDTISWAITYHLQDLRKARGEEIRQDGYTGK